MAQLMPQPLAVSHLSKIQIGFTFLVWAYPGNPGKRAVKQVCVCVSVMYFLVLMYILLHALYTCGHAVENADDV